MKFKSVYLKSEDQARKALLSLWTFGSHPMRKSVEDLLEREPLMAEPVFQSMFPWENVKDDSWRNYLNAEVIEKLGIGSENTPYVHQAKSWEVLHNDNNRKSIVVTSGTGSGKTECFMYPILNDIYTNKNDDGIQAIFLYPLNALMADQKNRLGKLCQKLGLKFGIYNGTTPDSVDPSEPVPFGGAQLLSRTQMRNNPPHILLSNPSMLEYILVRGADQKMIQPHQRKLKWIVIDEAHSYSGSSAVELSYQIRRILDAFGVNKEDVHFACTSATISGDGSDENLKNFISSLTGQLETKIEVIGGHRVIPEIADVELENIISENNIPVNLDALLKLRQEINEKEGLSLSDIWYILKSDMSTYNKSDALELIDQLCDLKVGGKQVLSLRAHFYMRTINGLYACSNPNCNNHFESPFGALTSYSGTICKECQSPMLAVAQCKVCHRFHLVGDSNASTHLIRQHFAENAVEDAFIVKQDDDISLEDRINDWPSFTISKNDMEQIPSGLHSRTYSLIKSSLGIKLEPQDRGEYVVCQDDKGMNKCLDCENALGVNGMFHFRVPVDMLNRLVGRVLLEETAEPGQDWGKYISFTDSRQGTAINAKLFNIESERFYASSHLIKSLVNCPETEEMKVLKTKYNEIKDILDYIVDPTKKASKRAELDKLEEQMRNVVPSLTMTEVGDTIFNRNLFNHLTPDYNQENDSLIKGYKSSLVRSVLSTKMIYQNSVESLGLVKIIYPKLKEIRLPQSLKDRNCALGRRFQDDDWRSYLEICLDYFFRLNNHIQPILDNEMEFVRDSSMSIPVFGSDNMNYDSMRKEDKKEIWPIIAENDGRVLKNQNRIVLLLCAALGIDSTESLSEPSNKVLVNNLLQQAWTDLTTSRILTRVEDDGTGYTDRRYNEENNRWKLHIGTYYLNMRNNDSSPCRVILSNKVWRCPASHIFINSHFCGYSPIIKGQLKPENISQYKLNLDDTLKMPIPKQENLDAMDEWLQNDPDVRNLKSQGLWSDVYENYFKFKSSYVAAEHSGQQSDEMLKKYVNQFMNTHEVNVLNCSTTMEMGVDIGSIDVVLMDTVPPAAANYLQRAGRAGRGGQTRSLAFTLCNTTPIGMKTFHNPKWPFEEPTIMKMVKSSPSIVQRHKNSFFFRKFIVDNLENLNLTAVTEKEEFFGADAGANAIVDSFIDSLNSYLQNQSLKQDYKKIFGDEMNIVATQNKIKALKKDFDSVNDYFNHEIVKVEDLLSDDPDNSYLQRKQKSLLIQSRRVNEDNLLIYLSENQFLPNANMPTGVATFDHTDRDQMDQKYTLQNSIKANKEKISQLKQKGSLTDADKAEIVSLRDQSRGTRKRLERLSKATESSRDIKTALNEYAPGQTVVINEKNYVSAGISLYDNKDGASKFRFIYHCEHCGNTIYRESQLPDNECNCRKCNNGAYLSIIQSEANRGIHFTKAIEPVKFRTIGLKRANRREQTVKRYYDIGTELTQLSWVNAKRINNVEMVSQDEGEIIYFNRGLGSGFAVCLSCGRSILETGANNVLPEHQTLEGEICNTPQVRRNFVFTGRHQTCYTAFRFYSDNLLQNDEGLVLSLGVIIKRALVQFLHVDNNEIDFGIKNEEKAKVLYIFDTNKSGCGYSTYLGDENVCIQVLDLACQLLENSACSCEFDSDGAHSACSQCLIDRDSVQFIGKLSKGKALKWLIEQKGNRIPVPEDVKAVHADAMSCAENLSCLLKKYVAMANVSELTICAKASSDMQISDWNNMNSEVGSLLNQALQGGKKINIVLQVGQLSPNNAEDFINLVNLDKVLPNFKIIPVKSLGLLPSVMLVKMGDNTFHYFTNDKADKLVFSDEWLHSTDVLFRDESIPAFEKTILPSLNGIKNLLNESGKVLFEGDIKKGFYPISHIFENAIYPSVLKGTNGIDLMAEILMNKNVSVYFSDSYVYSALASLILVHLINELRTMLKFNLISLTLDIDNTNPYKKPNGHFNDYFTIDRNFASEEEARDYLDQQINDVLNIDEVTYNYTNKHHRTLQFRSDAGIVEFRPDHGINGGWQSRETYRNLNAVSGNSLIQKSQGGNADIIYYIIIKKNE